MSDRPSFRSEIQRELAPALGLPGIVEFSESSAYCNKPLYPAQRILLKLIFLEEMEGWEEDILSEWIAGGRHNEVVISPAVRERRDYCRDHGYEHFGQIAWVGGRRSGKGHVTALAGAHKIHRIRQIPNPGAHFGIDSDKQIYISCIAAAQHQAKRFQYADLWSTIRGCKALEPYVVKAQEESLSIRTDADDRTLERAKAQGIKVDRDISTIRVTPLAANEDTIRGATSIMAVFDEFAHLMSGDSRSSDTQCYIALRPSLAQFGPNAIVFLNSSPYSEQGEFHTQYQIAMRPQDGPDPWFPMRLAFQSPSWSMYDHWWKDPNRRWRNAIMVSPDWPDQLEKNEPASKLDSFSIEKRQQEQLEELANPESYAVEYRAQWAKVLDAYLSPKTVELAFRGVKPDGEPLTMSDSGTYVQEYRMHCDPSSTTAGFGFAIAHVEEFPDPTGLFPDGKARHVIFDRVWRWNPKDFPGGTINYVTVREELQSWIDIYRPSEFSFDQFNSVLIAQELREWCRAKGIMETRVLDVAATARSNWDMYEALKTALNLHLVHMPADCIDEETGFNHSEWAMWELQRLRELPGGQFKRIEKSDIGLVRTKDTADCVANIVHKFLASYIGRMTHQSAQQTMQFGSQGGYPLGGRQEGGPMAGLPDGKGRREMADWYASRSNSSFPRRTRGILPTRRRA